MTNAERARRWIEDRDLGRATVESDVMSLAMQFDKVRDDAQQSAVDAAARPFARESCCPECGERMLPAVSLWRCSAHPSEHQAVGPGVAYEIRECSAVVAQAPKPLRPLADDTTEARGDGRS